MTAAFLHLRLGGTSKSHWLNRRPLYVYCLLLFLYLPVFNVIFGFQFLVMLTRQVLKITNVRQATTRKRTDNKNTEQNSNNRWSSQLVSWPKRQATGQLVNKVTQKTDNNKISRNARRMYAIYNYQPLSGTQCGCWMLLPLYLPSKSQ